MTDQTIPLDRHPILMEQYEVCQAIEVCGASPALTAAVTKAGAVLDHLKDLVLQVETLNAETEYLSAQVQALTPQVARLERDKQELESMVRRIIGIAKKVGYQNNGTMLLSDFLYIRLTPDPLLTDEES